MRTHRNEVTRIWWSVYRKELYKRGRKIVEGQFHFYPRAFIADFISDGEIAIQRSVALLSAVDSAD